VKKTELLENIRGGRAALLQAIDGLPDDVFMRPFVVGHWSIKDVLAHLTVWESELITALAGIGSPAKMPHLITIEDFDEFNEEQYHVNVRRPLEIILEDFHGVHKQLLRTVEGIDEAILNDTRRFRWMEGEPIWLLIEDNGYLHEREHAEDITAWRQEQGL
jgi:hypothetical protein